MIYIEGDHIQAGYESDLLEAIRRMNLTGTYLDIGAHVGHHAAFFRSKCEALQVIAVEPNPVVLPVLHQNAKQYDFIVIAAAIHDTWDEVEVIQGPQGNTGMAHVIKSDMAHVIKGNHVAVLRLDDLPEAALVKIDVEGMELAVLRSGIKMLEAHHPVLSVEAATPEAQKAVANFLTPMNYRRLPRQYARTPTFLWV
jgi:FkbM family methyltransferase